MGMKMVEVKKKVFVHGNVIEYIYNTEEKYYFSLVMYLHTIGLNTL